MDKLYLKINEVKREIGAISKDSKNPFYKSSYFDINKLLAEVEPILFKNKLMVLQPILNGVVTTEIIDIETGTKITSSIPLPEIADPQKLGSAITYFRRYTLKSLLALQEIDDDANLAASKIKDKKVSKTDNLPWLNKTDKKGDVTPQWTNLLLAITEGRIKKIQDVIVAYKVSKEVSEDIEKALKI